MDVHGCLLENSGLLSFMYKVTMIASIIHEPDCRLFSPLIMLSSYCSQFVKKMPPNSIFRRLVLFNQRSETTKSSVYDDK